MRMCACMCLLVCVHVCSGLCVRLGVPRAFAHAVCLCRIIYIYVRGYVDAMWKFVMYMICGECLCV